MADGLAFGQKSDDSVVKIDTVNKNALKDLCLMDIGLHLLG